ncbi:uncharacterized protein LOC142358024 [Convolutriloba macropyga]|uniref:uncharacterized protein LOC142358024 n=1 Tax=Convolutriloba macropyga TaxID=536237 RepID=UPI003F51DDAA
MTGKKRGLSLEDKKEKVMEIFYESSDVFLLKEIEKLAVKKGVTFQSVKDVVQELVDMDVLHQEKIGTSNFFWAFPSEASVKLEKEHRAAKSQLDSSEKALELLSNELDKVRAERANNGDISKRMEEFSQLKAQEQDLQRQLHSLQSSDHVLFQELGDAIPTARDSANRWLDNIDMLRDWTKKKFSGMEDQVDNFFHENGFTDDMEQLE